MSRGDDGRPPDAEPHPAESDDPGDIFRGRPGDEIVEPLFAGLRDAGESAPKEGLVPRTGWRAALWWRLRLLFRRKS